MKMNQSIQLENDRQLKIFILFAAVGSSMCSIRMCKSPEEAYVFLNNVELCWKAFAGVMLPDYNKIPVDLNSVSGAISRLMNIHFGTRMEKHIIGDEEEDDT